MPASIQKLDETVVNRIAAGEVIQRPANALKEMLENSIDAGATLIQITVKDGGLKLLQVQDNGLGINREDLEIVCERFTTSKLRKFEDLSSISTFGFRGEALASISHVAHLTIVTKTANQQYALKCQYVDGKLKGPPKPCAGTQGTQIIVEDLFYNVPTRKNALKSASEEYARINEVVTRYAVHYSAISFLLKKSTESGADVRTPANSNPVDNIRVTFGNAVAKNLCEVKAEDFNYKFKAHGWISNIEYSGTKFVMLLFINGRLVESTALKKALDVVYNSYLGKGKRPFVYLSLELAPCNVDVNVHPTKHEVHFLHEDTITEKIQQAVDVVLRRSCGTRTFTTQAVLPGVTLVEEKIASKSSATPASTSSVSISSAAPKVYEHSMVRTDSRDQKLDKFLTSRPSGSAAEAQKQPKVPEKGPETPKPAESETSGTEIQNEEYKRRTFNLTSLQQLRAAVNQKSQQEIRDVLRNSTFVGCVSNKQMLIQHQTKLFIANSKRMSEEYFYQLMLNDFGNFGVIKFSSPLPLYDVAMLALEGENSGWTEADGPKETLAGYVKQLLQSKKEMLEDYFSFFIDDQGNLLGIPLLLKHYMPDMAMLPMYVLRVATDTEWEVEKDCFDTFCRITAQFYSHVKFSEDAAFGKSWKWILEHVIYPCLKSSLVPRSSWVGDGTIVQVADLPDLYKVFERC